ncbi:hypothetical protein KY348_00615, partial [Candidatus Woesearchaeota archaeon]|nr:hypothetical protein [Candidatus Woesearchaeota archaeon]
KEFYIYTEEGKQFLKDLFSQANIEAYVRVLPPYPEQINNESIDYVVAINAAFELMATPYQGKPADIEGIITETHKKLKNNGSFIVQGLTSNDIDLFRMHVCDAIKKKKLSFEEDYEFLGSLEGPFSFAGMGYWARWEKKK